MNKIVNTDCIKYMKKMLDNSVVLTLTDIPYGKVNRDSNGLRNLDKYKADVETFNLDEFLQLIYKVTKGTCIVFCGHEQYSTIFDFFNQKQKQKKGTVRQIVWQKSNPSPMNGQHIYLAGTENAVWFKKRGGTFNAHCKKNVFAHPCGRSKLHPTEKNHGLLKELILDNSDDGDLVFDPCAGSGSHLLVAQENHRKYLGIELDSEYMKIAEARIKK